MSEVLGKPPKYWFCRCDFASTTHGSDISGNQSGCVFLRGYKIAIRESPKFTSKYAEVAYIPHLNPDQVLSKADTPLPPGVQQWAPHSAVYKLPTTNQSGLLPDGNGIDSEMSNDIEHPAKYEVC